MQRLSDVIADAADLVATRLEMKEGEIRHLALLGWNEREGNYGTYVTLRLRDEEKGETYYLSTSAAQVMAALGALQRIIDEGRVQLPLWVSIKRTKRSWVIS